MPMQPMLSRFVLSAASPRLRRRSTVGAAAHDEADEFRSLGSIAEAELVLSRSQPRSVTRLVDLECGRRRRSF